MKDSIYEQEVEEDALQWPPIDLPVTQQLPLTPAVELWDGEVVRRDTAITYLAELNYQQVDK